MLYNIVIHMSRGQKSLVLLVMDIVLAGLAYLLSAGLLYTAFPRYVLKFNIAIDLIVFMALCGLLTVMIGLHKIKLNAYEMHGIAETSCLVFPLVCLSTILSYLIAPYMTTPMVFVLAGLLFLILAVSARVSLRAVLRRIYRHGNTALNVLIYGAGQTGQQLASALSTDTRVRVVAYIDDDPRLHSLVIAGLRVHAAGDISDLLVKHDVRRVVLAMPKAGQAVLASLSNRLQSLGCEVHTMRPFADLIADDSKNMADTDPIDLGQMLGRQQLEEELPGASEWYRDKIVLVTGAGGSVGSEICRQILSCNPRKLVMLDHSEHALFQINRELTPLAGAIEIVPVLGSVTDRALIEYLVTRDRFDMVLHAAAYKHVHMLEGNVAEGMFNNVFGTKLLADAARSAGIARFVMVSTDKAVRPSSVMGASKRFAEMVIQDLATRTHNTQFCIVRFGNVLGSSGSVIPIFAEQIAAGGPVTLTHNDVTRYFMTISEAVRLVLLAETFARKGDVLVLDMGQPVSVMQLARRMVESYGKTLRDKNNPNGDIEIRVTGLRPGEKMHEELLINSEKISTPHPKIWRAQETHPSEIEIAKALNELRDAIAARDESALKAAIQKWIERSDMDEAVNQ